LILTKDLGRKSRTRCFVQCRRGMGSILHLVSEDTGGAGMVIGSGLLDASR